MQTKPVIQTQNFYLTNEQMILKIIIITHWSAGKTAWQAVNFTTDSS